MNNAKPRIIGTLRAEHNDSGNLALRDDFGLAPNAQLSSIAVIMHGRATVNLQEVGFGGFSDY